MGWRQPPPGIQRMSAKFPSLRDVGADDAVAAAVAMAQDGRARAVAEKHAGVALRPIGDRGQLLRADDEDGVVGVGGDELLRDFDREKETGAGRRDVEAGGFRRADLGLHETGGRRERPCPGVAVATRMRSISSPAMSGLLHRGEGGLGAHVAGVFVVRGDAAFLDAGASGDPLVVGRRRSSRGRRSSGLSPARSCRCQ